GTGPPGAGGPSAVSGGATPAGGAAEARTASDRGISPDKVKVGFMLQNPAGLAGAGFSTGQRSDGPAYIEAMARWATENGAAHGREVVPVVRLTDPTSVADQAAACRAMVDDAKVFAVIDVAAMLDTPALDCLANRRKGDTPFVHSVMWSRDWQARSGGNEVSYQAAIDRIAVTWARDLAAIGWLPRGATVGVFGDNCPATEPTVRNVLKPALEARGAGRVVVGLHDCNIQAVVAQPPAIATQMRLEGVTHVLIVSNFVAGQVFVTTMASQNHRPRYSTSDWFLNTSDSTQANFNPDQFDGAIGIASLGSMLTQSGRAPYPGWQTCSRIATEAGLPPIGPGDDSSTELLSLCDNFLLFLDAVNAAGTNPTRASWRQAVANLGEHPSAVFGPSRFARGKLTGSDYVHTVQWQRGCRCWRSISDSRPAAPG
ncbi:MAG TPA: hypothetical protein VJ804_09575, partial [Acidimicrobiales bacterium]|nr:hypothetical protein [Acidimicrobiales bacterium]